MEKHKNRNPQNVEGGRVMPQVMYRRESNNKISSDYVPKIKVMDSAGKQLSISIVSGDCGYLNCESKSVWGTVFQSNGSNVAYIRKGVVHLYKPYWNMFSQSTNKYLLQFLGESSIADVREKVKSGEYIEL